LYELGIERSKGFELMDSKEAGQKSLSCSPRSERMLLEFNDNLTLKGILK